MHRIQSSGYGTDSNGKNYFKSSPLPPTVISAEWLNAVQEEICAVVENAGLSVHDKDGDTHQDLWAALLAIGRPQDLVISSQATWNNAIERTGANAYRFKTGYRSIYVKYIVGGYSMVSGSGPLSGGDTWGYLALNECTNLQFESGAYINVGDTPGYINVATAGAVLDNVYIKGTGSVEAAVQYSFLTAADRVTYRNCMTSNRYTNVDFAAFSGGSYRSARYEGCKVYSIDCNTAAKIIRAFYQCYNLNTPYIEDITVAAGVLKLVDSCEEITNLNVYNVSSANAITIIYSSNHISDFDINTVAGTTGQTVRGMDACSQISSGIIQSITTGIISGMYACSCITACTIQNITDTTTNAITAMESCESISSCYIYNLNTANSTAFGIYLGINVSSCKISTIASSTGNQGTGFQTCHGVSSCYATACDSSGFTSCDRVIGCNSISNGVYGFNTCIGMYMNTGTSNGTKDYHACKVDLSAAIAVTADTVASGCNDGTNYD